MKNILVVETSPGGDNSITRKASAKFLDAIKAAHPGAAITTRDLTANTLPHLTQEVINAFYTPSDKRSSELSAALTLSDTLIAELSSADVVVLTSPMWNFSVPSVLKAWIDHVVRVGVTFSYGANGPQGLLRSKPVYAITASAGAYSEGPYKAYDFVEPYLRTVLGFIGLTDVRFFKAEGASSPEGRAQALTNVEAQFASATL